MAGDAEIGKFIQKKLKSGYPAGELRNDLLNKGYSAEEIDKLFLEISLQGKRENKDTRKSELHVLSLLGISLIITGIALMGTRIWLTEYAPYMIVTGALGLGTGFYISSGKKKNDGSL